MDISSWFYQFLKKTQKYTGTDNVYLAKGGFWLTLGQAVSIAAAFSSAVAFANLLDPTTYGNYKYVLSLLGMFGVFSLEGMRAAVTQAVARGLEGSFYTAFKTKLKWGLLGSLVAIGGAIYYWIQGNNLLPIPLLIAAASSPLMYASQVSGAFLGGRKLFKIQVSYGLVNQVVSAGIIITALFFTKNLFWLIAIYFVSHTFLNYFFYLLTKIRFHPNKEEDEKTISYGKHVSLMAVINYIAVYLDKIMLFNLAGPAQLAVYSFATLAPEQINSTLSSINDLAFPKLAPKSREEIKANIMKKFWKLAFLAGIIIAAYVILAPYLYRIFFPQYLDAILYSQVYMLCLVSLPGSLLGTAFQAKMMKKQLYFLRTIALSRLVLFAILIPVFGIWGVVMARVGAEVFSLFLNLFLFRKF